MIRRIHSLTFTAGAALLLVTSLSAGAYAQGVGAGRREHVGRAGVLGLRQLDLTEAQRQQVQDVMQRYRDEMRGAGQRLREAHHAQRAAVEAVPLNEGLIRSTAQTLANAQTDLALLQARIHNDVWALLTPEQQERAKQLRAQRDARMKQRLERRRPRRQG